MENLIRIILEGAYGNFKKIFFATDRVTDMEMRADILGGDVKSTDKVANQACIGCAGCSNVCPTGAITMKNLERSEKLMEGWTKTQIPELDDEKCVFCYYCHDFCPVYSLFGESATIHPNDVGKVELKLSELMDQPVKISEDKIAFISQFLSDKTIIENNKELGSD
ncbi:MAG: 4Fe-4S dicluster domain-containing protein [Methanobrevibacter sp.]|jgi:energy-converting hydrogenase B subunit L|nr:4Fe-4S dicluster domain-containing protein [Candidatus Methanovirga aequatorialis]